MRTIRSDAGRGGSASSRSGPGPGKLRPRLAEAETLSCGLATSDDDADLRGLLRDGAMEGWVRLAFTAEPSWFGALAVEGGRTATVVMRRRRDGSVVGMGSRAVKEVWLRGRPALLGYLGGLRFAPGRRPGRRALVRGYALARSLRRSDELPFDLTSVVADNAPARRLLERGLPGMPRYTPLAELVTLVLPTRSGRRNRGSPADGDGMRVEEVETDVDAEPRSSGASLDAVAACLERPGRTCVLAPRWTRMRLDDLASGGLGDWRPFLARRGSEIVGCAAVWDQRALRQLVVRGYTPWLRRLRPALDVAMRLAGRTGLPAPGTVLRLGYLSHLAAEPEAMPRLVEAARERALGMGLDHLALGLPEGRPELDLLRRRFGGHEYRSVLYAVHGRDVDAGSLALDAGRVNVEVATL